jgi:tetratricopeptide (TPR) repeat protein/serine/threonine protein kinase
MQPAAPQIESILAAAVDIASEAERGEFVERACAGNAELRRRIEELIANHFRAGSFLEGAAPGVVATTDDPMHELPGTAIGPYKLLEQIGEGGFGIVFMAEQQEPIRRKVALKVLKAGMDSSQVIARFEAERQALALMDHANIAKVLDAGQTDVGRPFFVMELVKGRPITEFCDQGQLSTTERLELFVHVCQAVQHAHQKGIIHRDIKPSNVLVTLQDGMPLVKVIDFGIAKALGQQLTDRTLFTGFTQMIGTPLYMSPEQAALSNVDVDTRSDVYSLGVLLYELLTGTTPFTKERLQEAGYDEMRRIIREEEPPKPSTRISTLGQAATTVSTQRKSDPKRLSQLVRGELDWIVMKALEKDRNRRYESASAFAADVQRYLADEPVLACPPSVAYRFRKFARRHRTGLLMTAAALLVLIVGGSGIGWVLRDRAAQEETRRGERAERLVETDRTASVALARAEQWAGQAEGRRTATSQDEDAVLAVWGQADAALAEAMAALRTGVAEEPLQQRVEAVRQRLEQGRRQTEQRRTRALRQEKLLHDLDAARSRRLTLIDNTYDHAGGAAEYQAAFAAYGLEVKADRIAELARRIGGEEPAIRNALLVALEDWALWGTPSMKPSGATLWALAEAADDDPWRKRFRAAVHTGDRARFRELSALARTSSLPPLSLALLAAGLFTVGEHDEALALLRWARGRHPTDFFLHMQLGTSLSTKGTHTPSLLEREEAVGCCRTALALRPHSTVAHYVLGLALSERGQFDEAIAEHREVLRRDKNHAEAYLSLGFALLGKREFDQAIDTYREAIRIKNRAQYHTNLGLALAGKHRMAEAIAEHREAIRLDKDHAESHTNLGLALEDVGQREEAIAEYREAIRLDTKLANPHNNLGSALQEKGQLDEAIAEYREAVRLNKDLPAPHNNLGNALWAKGQLDEAIAEYREAIRLDTNDPQIHYHVGLVLQDRGRLDEAIAEYREAIRLRKTLPYPHNSLGSALHAKGQLGEAIAEYYEAIRLQKEYAEAHANLGRALHAQGRLDEAIAEFRAAIRLEKEHPQGQLDDAIPDYRRGGPLKKNDAFTHYSFGTVLWDRHLVDDAMAEWREAIRLKKDFAEAHAALGTAFDHRGQLDEAIAKYREAIGFKKDFPPAHNNLGKALQDKGQLDEAIAEYREAIRLKPDYALVHSNLGRALQAKGRLDEAIAAYREVIRLKKDDAEAHYALGVALHRRGQLDDAIAAYHEAIRLKKDLPEAHYNLGNAWRDKGRLDDAIAEYREAIRLKKDHPNVHFNLGTALYDKGQLDDAIAEYREAVRLKKDFAEAHYCLGNALRGRDQREEAIAEYRAAIRFKPDYAEAHCNLGAALLEQGEFRQALQARRRGHELGQAAGPRWPYPSAQWVRECERLVELDEKLPDFLEGKPTPASAAERIELAGVCLYKRLYRASARFYADAFAIDSKLADDLKASHRYRAAAIAALAGCGQGKDADKLDDKERASLRRQALDWLQAEREAWDHLLDRPADQARTAASVAQAAQHWLKDTPFAGVRGGEALAKLPEAERQPWQKLWDDVATMAARARDKIPPEKKSPEK